MSRERIRILSLEGHIEESAGRRIFNVIPEEDILEYEKRMLKVGTEYVLPMYTLDEDGKQKAYYDFTGYMQLEDYINRQKDGTLSSLNDQRPVDCALDILAGILGGIKGLESYLIFQERITIHPDTIFVELDSGQIVFAFYPQEKPELSFQIRIISLMEEIAVMYGDEEVKRHFHQLKDFILTMNPGLDGIIGMLGVIQREVSFIYWNTNKLRKIEEEPEIEEYKDIAAAGRNRGRFGFIKKLFT